MKSSLKAHLFVLTANIIYGANYSIAKGIMPALIAPFGFILIRVSVAALLFFISHRLLIKERVAASDRRRLLLCAVFGVAVNQLLFFKGLSMTSPINSGLMMVTNPIFVMLLSAIFLRELLTARKVTGILAGLSGAVLLILYKGSQSTATSSMAGDICVLLNSLSYAGYIVMVKPLMGKYQPLTIMQFVFFWGFLMVLPFGWQEFSAVQWSAFGANEFAALAFVVIGTTFFAYLLNTLALRELSAGVVSVYIYLQPLMAAGFAMLLGRDHPAPVHLYASVLIFLGVFLTTTRLRPKVEAGL